MLRRIVWCICVWSFISFAYGQVGTWKSFTSMKSVRSAVRIGSRVWAATSGGVFVYDTTSASYTKYTNVDGLLSNDLYAIGTDAGGRIWVGASNGSINVFDPVKQQWQAVNDIYESTSYANKTIHKFISKGDSVLVVSDFGVSVFRLSKWEFEDTYSNFGFASTPLTTCAVLQGNRLWVGTSLGVTSGLLGNSSAVLWNSVYTSLGSFNTTAVSAMAVFHDSLLVGTTAGAVFFDPATQTFQTVPSLAGKSIADFQYDTLTDRLFILAAGDGVKALSSVNGSLVNLYASYTQSAPAFVQNDRARLASSSNGIVEWKNGWWISKIPNGPNANTFASLLVDGNGILWCAPGEVANAGFYRYDPRVVDSLQWKNFNSLNSSLMVDHGGSAADYCHKVSSGLNGSVWVSTWGNGFYVVQHDSVVKRIDHYTVSPGLNGAVVTNPAFAVGSGTAVDASGQLWLALLNAYNGNSLTRMLTDSTDQLYVNPNNYGGFVDIVIDQYDTKWFSCALPEHTLKEQGLYYYNQNIGWGSVNGLPNTTPLVYCNTLDQNGSLWIGTGYGLAIINDLSNPQSLTSSSLTIPYYLAAEVIQTIAVDGNNNKWLGTKEGVIEVNADATEVLQHYTVSSTNGKLVSDDIWNIAIDQQRGIAYFATQAGLSSVQIGTTMPGNSMSSLFMYPNPYKIPNDQQLAIQGLAANTTIKILSVSGTVVNEFPAQNGGRAFWDGKNKRGAYVPSGVYFIVAHANNGAEVATGKVAVIRH